MNIKSLIQYFDDNPLEESLLFVADFNSEMQTIQIQYDYAAQSVSDYYESILKGEKLNKDRLRDFRCLTFKGVKSINIDGETIEDSEPIYEEELLGRYPIIECWVSGKNDEGEIIQFTVTNGPTIRFVTTGASWKQRLGKHKKVKGENRYYDVKDGQLIDFYCPFKRII